MSWALVAVSGAELSMGLANAAKTRQAAELTRGLNDINAKYAEFDAYQTEQYGAAEAASYEKQVNEVIGGQKVAYAAKNVDVTSGTAAAVQAETKATGFLNTLKIQEEAHMKALGFMREAQQIRYKGSVEQSQAEQSANAQATSAGLGALRSGISGYYRGAGTYGDSSSID